MIVYREEKGGLITLDVSTLTAEELTEEVLDRFYVIVRKKWWESHRRFLKRIAKVYKQKSNTMVTYKGKVL